jgi:hypothetical protein
MNRYGRSMNYHECGRAAAIGPGAEMAGRTSAAGNDHGRNTMHRIARILAALVVAALTATGAAPAALARVAPPYAPTPVHPGLQVHIVTVGGMPGWQITLIAVAAALTAATLAVVLERARAARRQGTAPAT